MKKKDIVVLVELIVSRCNLYKEISGLEDWINLNKKEYDTSVNILKNTELYDSSIVDYAKEFVDEYESKVQQCSCDEDVLSIIEKQIEEL